MKDPVLRWRGWFWAAAIYNALWGAFTLAFPQFFFLGSGMAPANYPFLMQCIGMIVGVYAIGYALVAWDPKRYGAFVFVGLLGKIFGPIGFLFEAVRGNLPWSFGWVNVFNDLIWLPAFSLFALAWVREERSSAPLREPKNEAQLTD